ncbi:AcrR family transcriptional regulator [Paenibacillus phyllosphaerae]|uniref:AcrR family transcriptional regulator n=1 Tax=Paenibacillus phyllosphaerae TaxID=274593 RepID=A0A7W5FM40_9BACL|nr:TetR/AcrR family transcriptional regulator [Paenibacillus phyllosphaerae]MBB3109871.1 AcrR family transcriptional regulator [Paenibacillus phyllosphaerae]
MVEGNKKQQIIQAAIQCFSEKGYRGTSIQDIADVLGIAKGSLYFYFKSKSDLLHSIMKDYMDNIAAEFAELHARTDLTSRDLLACRIVMSYNLYEENQNFFSMLLKERFEINDEIQELVMGFRRQGLFVTHELICSTYGEAIRPAARDLTIIFEAMIQNYLGMRVIEQKSFDTSKLSDYLMNRLDAMAADLLSEGAPYVLSPEMVEEWSASNKHGRGKSLKAELLLEVKEIREQAAWYVKEPSALEEIHSSLEVLYAELEKPQPQQVVVKGMLVLLKSIQAPELRKRLAKLEAGINEVQT